MNDTIVSLMYRSGERYSVTLVEQATLTDRVFPESWHHAGDGERYQAEYSAIAVDEDGAEYLFVWRFDAIRGQEPDDDSLPWEDESNIYSVECIS